MKTTSCQTMNIFRAINLLQLNYYILLLTFKSPSAAAAGTDNRTFAVSSPFLIRHLSPEQIEKGRTLPTTPPLGTSTYNMNRLAQEEVNVAQSLRDMAHALEEVSLSLKRYSSSWEELEKAEIDSVGWAEHPLHAYALTKHVSLGWPAIEYALLSLKNMTSVVDELLERRTKTGVPTEQDLTSVAGGLARLHDFYSFNLTAFSDAHIVSRLNHQPMTSKITPSVWDLYNIGTEAARINIWNAGVDFLRAALRRYSSSSVYPAASTSWSASATSSFDVDVSDHPFDRVDDIGHLEETLRKTVKMHDHVLERKGSRTRQHSTHQKPLDKTLARKKKYHKKQEVVLDPSGNLLQGLNQYVQLCRGEDLRPPEATSGLYCRYVSNGSPHYLIGPLRMEVHSISPYVVTFEDVLTHSEALELRQTSSVLLEQSSTFKFNGDAEVSHQRTSSTAWLYDHNSKHLPVLIDRIEHLSGLDAKLKYGSETFQVVNYGVGGHYTMHHDATAVQPIFDRISTFLIYLSDVPQGGSTVFPWLGFGVQPKRGRSLLWYNLNKNGHRDNRLMHGACPVLLGDKWIINKWLNYGAQLLHVPCDIGDQNAYIQQPLA